MLSFWLLAILGSSSANEDPTHPKESEEWAGYSVALHLFLPVAGFCILWGKRDLLNKLMLQIDRNCISVFCPSLSQREKLLKWASENLPTTWSSPSKTLSGGIPDLWKDGSLLCTLINMAVPGACPNPPKHWKKPPTHGQALAYKYLGVTPVFTENDFEGSFSSTQQKKFLMYLQEIQQAMKIRNAENENLNFSSAYLTKGMGLQTGEQYRKTVFYIYSNTTSSNCNNILVYIRGPYCSKGTATVPAFYNLNSIPVLDYSHKFRTNEKIVFKKETRRSFLKSIALDFTSFVNLEKKVATNDVPIHIEIEHDRAKISYIPNNYGIYEINLITNGEILKGSPFTANIIESSSSKRDSFESTEKILKELPAIRKKRIVSRYIDCINEKIQLNNSEDFRKKLSTKTVASFSDINNQGDSLKSENSVDHPNPIAVAQQEGQSYVHENKTYQSELFNKLEKINEDQYESENEYLQDENHVENITHETLQEMMFENWFSQRDLNIIPTVSVTEPEEDAHIVDETENFLEKVNNDNNDDNMSKTDFSTINSPETEGTGDEISSLIRIEEIKVEENNVIASIKPFTQCEEQQRSLKENEKASDPKDMIGVKNRNHIEEMRKVYENSSSNNCSSKYVHSEIVIDKNNFKKNIENRSTFPEIQNRPTSIVSPFLKITKLTSVENPIENGENTQLDDLKQDLNGVSVLHINEHELKGCKTKNEIPFVAKFVHQNHSNNQKLSDENPIYRTSNSKELSSAKQNKIVVENNYVESLKSILMTKMNSQSNNTKTFKDLVNTANQIKGMDDFRDMQDENNNEFKYESPTVASPICTDHIVQEVETSQSVEDLPLLERRKIFTRQQCVSVPSSNNSSISGSENEDVSEQFDGHKDILRVLSVMDTIRKSTSRYSLNRTSSISVPNISKTENIENNYSSSYISTASADFRSTFLKTREYWKKMSSEKCLSHTSYNSIHETEHMNPKFRNSRNSLSYLPEIHKSADDILSMSMNFKTHRLRRYSSLNQKDMETIDFISIEERKKRLLQDKYEQECLGSRFIKKRILSRINQECKIEKIQNVAQLEKEGHTEKEIFRKPSPLLNIGDSNTISAEKKEEGNELVVKKESQFKRAITFFKNLEQSASVKRKPMVQRKIKPEIRRRLSLDFQKQKNTTKIGGSLRAPKTLEKFSVTQIYFDIMSNKRGSFKGSPNRKALSETLASFATNDNAKQIQNKEPEDGIKFDMFLNKLKTKKRKSIKSVFDIHY